MESIPPELAALQKTLEAADFNDPAIRDQAVHCVLSIKMVILNKNGPWALAWSLDRTKEALAKLETMLAAP